MIAVLLKIGNSYVNHFLHKKSFKLYVNFAAICLTLNNKNHTNPAYDPNLI